MAKDLNTSSDIRTVNKHMERCIGVGSTDLHTTMHTFHTGMGKKFKNRQYQMWKDVEQMELSYIAVWNEIAPTTSDTPIGSFFKS